MGKEFLVTLSVRRILGCTNANGKGLMLAIGMKDSVESAAEAVTMTGENIGASHTRQKDNEFIAANTTLDVTLTEVAADGLTHFVKHFIPK